jgi:hypothetical protein
MRRQNFNLERQLLARMQVFLAIVMLSTAPMLVGCTANQQSRQLTTQLRKLTAEYSAASTQKIQAEQNFYLDASKNLENTLNVVDPTKEPTGVKETLAYGRIITATNSASLNLASELIDSPGSARVAPKISAFIQDGVQSEDQAFREARAQEAQATIAMATDFAAIEQYQTTLTNLAQQLSELEKPQSFSANASEIEAIGKAVTEQIKKGQSQNK